MRTLSYLGYILFLKETLSKSATTLVFIGFASHTLAFLVRYPEAGYTPVTNLYESLLFFVWVVIGILLVVQLKYPVMVLGAFLSPIALILMLFALAQVMNFKPAFSTSLPNSTATGPQANL